MKDASRATDLTPASCIEEMAASFVQRFRRGERPSIAEYARRYPDLAGQIEEIFQALVVIEQVHGELQAVSPDVMPFAEPPPLSILGDFRIIREIGRGGMGVVYEAEQVSLGRRVALKILSTSLLSKGEHRKRFQREARAAAQLHHTNIVPVFGVGEQNGVSYYVMQFIPGLGLDDVLKELIQQRSGVFPAPAAPTQKDAPEAEPRAAVSAGAMATKLWSGDLQRTVPVAGENIDSDGPADYLVKDRLTLVDVPSGPPSGTRPPAQQYAFPEQSGHTPKSSPNHAYWDNVARIGVQVAEGLHYAHEQGVVHRDIKPANLLLDSRGVAWVTDFGLAKATDSQDLTHTGDVLGTLRYLAPEQFDGRADARSDVYALGLTLYEMLVLHPAFDQKDRQQLIKEVTSGSPPRLRTLDNSIPRDLETIILKAIERAPSDRYQSAAEFAKDLQRYLDDEPIQARRASSVSRFRRWCRKHPAVAGLSVCLLLALVFLTHSQFRVINERDRFRSALFESLLSQARFHRLSGEVGQRTESLKAIAEAASLKTDASLRDEAIRGLTLHDLEPLSEWPVLFPSNAVDSVDVHPEFQSYVTYSHDLVGVREAVPTGGPTDRLLRRFPMNEKGTTGSYPIASGFSPDGRLLAVNFETFQGRALRLWEWRKGDLRLTIPGVTGNAFAINPSADRLICGTKDNEQSFLQVWDLQTGEKIRQQELPAEAFSISLDRSGTRFAISLPNAHRVVIGEWDAEEFQHDLTYSGDIYAVAWSPAGDALAVGKGFEIEIVDLESLESRYLLNGHRWLVHDILYHPSGNFLATHSLREGQTRIWDLRTRSELLKVDGHCVSFSRDGTRLALCGLDSISVARFVGENEYRTLATPDGFQFSSWKVRMHPRLPLLVECGQHGLRWWDLRTGVIAGERIGSAIDSVCFDPATGDLLTAGAGGVDRWSVTERTGEFTIADRTRLSFGEDGGPTSQIQAYGISCSQDGTRIVAGFRGASHVVLKDRNENQLHRYPVDPKSGYLDLSPDGRWIAVGNRDYPGFSVIDTTAGGERRTLSATESAGQVHFRPDGKQLIVCGNDRYRFFEVGSWKQLAELKRPAMVEGAAAYSPDGTLVALSMAPREVQLMDPQTLEVVSNLHSDRDTVNILSLSFSPPSGHLLSMGGGADGVRVWNLTRVRKALRELQLDWDHGNMAVP